MPNRFTPAAKKAAEITDSQLSKELSALKNLNREKIQELLPEKRDKEAFLELMQQVEAETSMDEKLAYLQKNLKTAGSIALTVLKALA